MSSTPTDPTTPDPEDGTPLEEEITLEEEIALDESSSPEDDFEPAGVLLEERTDVEYLEHVVVADSGPGLLSRVGAEAFGSFGLVLAGVGVGLYAAFNQVGVLGVALAFGLSLFVLVAAFGWISGGHYNPAVTLGAAIAGRIGWRDVLPYWLGQLVGGALATTVLVICLRTVPTVTPEISSQILGGAANGYGELSPFFAIAGAGFGLVAAILIEVVVTGVFVAVVLGVTGKGSRFLAAPAIGLAFTVGLLVSAPVTNGSMNPARSTAVAIFLGGEHLSQLWVFWVAPFLGAAIAGLLYGLFRAVDDEVEAADEDEIEILAVEHAES